MLRMRLCIGKIFRPNKKSFSSISSGPLIDSLVDELVEEISNDKIDPELFSIKRDIAQKYNVIDTKGSALITLQRERDKENIRITFSCNKLKDIYGKIEDENGFDTEIIASTNLPFDIELTKGQDTLLCNCTVHSSSESFTLQKVQLKESIPASTNDTAGQYKGPNYRDISPELRSSLHAYLFSKLDEEGDLLISLLHMAQDKERREYVNWLECLAERIARLS